MIAIEPDKTATGGPASAASGTTRSGEFRPWRVLVRRRWQLLGCLLLVCGVACAAAILRAPQYEGVARVQVVMDQPKISGLPALSGIVDRDYFSTQVQLLGSRHVLARAAQNLNLAGGRWAHTDEGLKDLRDRVSIKPVGASRLIDIVGAAATPAKAAAIANQVAAAFIEVSAETRRATSKRMIERVQEQIAHYGQEIQSLEEQLNRYREENLIAGARGALSAVETRLGRLETELTQLQLARLELQGKQMRLESRRTAGGELSDQQALPADFVADATLRGLEDSLCRLREQEVQLAQAYLPGHDKLRTVRLRLAEMETRALDYRRTLLDRLAQQTADSLAAATQREQQLTALLAEQKQQAVKLTEQGQRYESLLADLAQAQRFRGECVQRVRQFALEEGTSESPVMVVDAARIPTRPAGLRKSQQAASILLLGLLFSLGFVFALERFSADHQTPAPTLPMAPILLSPTGQPVSYWPAPFWPAFFPPAAPDAKPAGAGAPAAPCGELTHPALLGRLDTIALGGENETDAAFAARCRLAQTDPSCPQAETLRAVSSQLLGRFGATPQSLVVTNILPRSGKTTVACNLALLLAQTGRRVLLVDANLVRPALHRVFRPEPHAPTLAEVLAGRRQPDQAFQRTEVDNLFVLYLGETGDQPEPLDKNRLRAAVQTFADQFDWVLYDAGALQQDLARILLALVGKALGVAFGQDHDELAAALAQVEQCGAVAVGLVENRHVIAPAVAAPTS